MGERANALLNWIAKTPRYYRLLCRGIKRPPWSDSLVNCAAIPPSIRCEWDTWQ